MPSPSTSILVEMGSGASSAPREVQVGSRIAALDRDTLVPGETIAVDIEFWVEVGETFATPGSSFRLWYAGRDVGRGSFSSKN
jgi:hypothetical protein